MLSCDSCGLLVNFSCGWNMFSIKTLYVRAESIISGNISHILDIFFFFRRKAKLVPKFKLVSHNLFTDLTVGTAGVKKICTDHGYNRPWSCVLSTIPVLYHNSNIFCYLRKEAYKKRQISIEHWPLTSSGFEVVLMEEWNIIPKKIIRLYFEVFPCDTGLLFFWGAKVPTSEGNVLFVS